MTVDLALDEDTYGWLRDQITSGRFPDEAAVVRAGLLMMRGCGTDRDWHIAQLCRLAEEGERSGDAGPAEEVFAELRARFREVA